MRALDIHRYAGTQRHRPPPVSLREAVRFTPAQVERYAAEVGDWLAGVVVVPDGQRATAAGMNATLRRNVHRPPGAKTVLGVTGPNNVGKSTFVRRWVTEHYRNTVSATELQARELPRWAPEPGMSALRVPVVWLSPAGSMAKTAFQSQIAQFLGYQGTRAPTAALSLLNRHGVELLVVDDCHFLRTTNAVGRAMLDTLKTANNELGEGRGTLVLVGANLEGSELFSDPQIGGRLDLHRLPAYTINTDPQMRVWQRLLKGFEAVVAPYLPAAVSGFLARPAPMIWRETQGYLRDLHELVVNAVVEGILSGRWDVDIRRVCGDRQLSVRAEHEAKRLKAARTAR